MPVSELLADGLNTFIDTVAGLTLSPGPEDEIDIESIETDSILTGKGGVLIGAFRIYGYHGHVDKEAFTNLCESFKESLSPFMTSAENFWVKGFYESDGDQAKFELEENLSGLVSSARSMNVDVEKLIDEKISANAPHVQSETVILSFYYRGEVKGRSEVKYGASPIPTGRSLLLSESGNFTYKFESVLAQLHDFLGSLFDVDKMSSVDQLKAIYGSLNGYSVGRDWDPDIFDAEQAAQFVYRKYDNMDSPKSLFKRGFYGRALHRENDRSLEAFLPKPIDEQLVAFPVKPIGDSRVVVNNRAYEVVTIDKYMSSPMAFNYLVKTLRGIPFRMTFLITNNGLGASIVESLLAALVSWLPENKNRKLARDRLNSLAAHTKIVSMSINACVWSDMPEKFTPEGEAIRDLGELNYRAEKLKQGINGWGGCQATSMISNPTIGFFTTLPIAMFRHTTPRASLSIEEAISLMPLSRPTGLWRRGGFVMRSDDGKIVPMSIRSSQQNTDIRIITGEPGKGKSSLLFCSHFAYFFEPHGSGEMPILRCIDFGYSLKGLFEIIADGLEEHEKYKSIYRKIENSSRYTKNLFDLPLGQRTPLAFQQDFLINFLTLMCHTLSDYAGLKGLCTAVVKHAYSYYSDVNGNVNAKRYIVGKDDEIDRAIKRLGIEVIASKTPWYQIVDQFARRREFRLASRAQRYAVPTLIDIATIVNLPEIRDDYREIYHDVKVTKLFSRSITETAESLPMVSGVTVFDVSESNAVGLDLKDVIGNADGSNEGATRQSSLIYLAVMQMLTADFYTDEDEIALYNPEYYSFHKNRISTIARSKRCVSFDELHRLEMIPSAFREVDRFGAEGRKFGISVVAASQRPSQLPEGVRTLATTTFMCGGDKASLELINEQFSLSDEVKQKISYLRKPDRGGNYMYAYFRGTRSFGCFLRNTEGPTMLAAMATSQEDRHVLNTLAQEFGTYAKACEIFGGVYPGGTCANNIAERQTLNAKNRDDNPGRGNPRKPNILDNIIYDICKSHGRDYVNNGG